MLKKTIIVILLVLLGVGIFYQKTLVRLYQGFKLNQISKDRAKYYVLDNNTQIQDITQRLILDKSIPNDAKLPLIKGERRIVVFKYVSGTNYVAGYFSYLTTGNHPVMIFLRGGNSFFGIMRPNTKFSFLKGFNVVGTLYRGNIYGGEDEFAGADIDDVENLIKYFPQLERFTHTKLQVPFAMMGASRGATEMFAALSRSNYVKARVAHAISISGGVDLQESMNKRAEMKYLFMNKFKLRKSKNETFAEWLKIRNPVDNAKYLAKSLKVLLVYGLADNLVSLDEQKNFKKALDEAGIASQLITVPDAGHGLADHFDELEKIIIKFMRR